MIRPITAGPAPSSVTRNFGSMKKLEKAYPNPAWAISRAVKPGVRRRPGGPGGLGANSMAGAGMPRSFPRGSSVETLSRVNMERPPCEIMTKTGDDPSAPEEIP